mgnify:CR=1 FL=1
MGLYEKAVPVLDVQVVGGLKGATHAKVAHLIADEAAALFGTPARQTWVKLTFVPGDQYAENGGGPEPGVLPVFVSVLRRSAPDPKTVRAEAARLAEIVARACHRAPENVHIIYDAPGAGRVAFGGLLDPGA